MKYCTNCGAEMPDDADVCEKCGCTADAPAKDNSDTMKLVVKIFMVLSCVLGAFAIIPLAWCIPMTVFTFRSFKSGEKLSKGFKICSLLFVSLVAGIIMLCSDDM